MKAGNENLEGSDCKNLRMPETRLTASPMLAKAGLQLKPSSAALSSTGLPVTRRLAGKLPSSGGHSTMSIATLSNFSTASAGPRPRWLVRSSNRSTEVPLRNLTILCVFSRVAPSFSRDNFSAANICRWSKLWKNRWQRSRFEVEHRRAAPNRGFVNWGAVNPNCKASGVYRISSSSYVFRVVDGVERRDGFGPTREFHTASRREGTYICASPHEDLRPENFEENAVEIGHEDGIDGGVESVDSSPGELEKETSAPEIWVVNFYHFFSIEDPLVEVARHTAFLEGKDVRGRIYISHQGINAQLSGPGREAVEYAEWLKEDSRFSDILVQISPSPGGHAFPRLRLRYKPSLVQVEGGILHLPITDPSAIAVHLSPREWSERLDAATILSNNNAAVMQELGSSQDGQHDETSKDRKPVVLLDVRNGYEWDVGHFKGAQRPNVDCFMSTKFGLTETETGISDPLANVDKEVVDVMMYCTGGIRCDVFSTILRQKGFKNLYTLKGGVSNYLKEEGVRKWAGNLFVFDSRLAVSPKDYQMKESRGEEEEGLVESDTKEEMDCASSSAAQAFARCLLCGDPIAEPRHHNCANLDCNLLYLSCGDCLSQYKGSCSRSCSEAPRLRPLLDRHQYDRWHKYRPEEPKPPKRGDYVSRRALKRRRRKERRKLLVKDTAHEQLHVQILESHLSLAELQGTKFCDCQ